MLESIFLDFWKDKFTLDILCFLSLLILSLEVEVIKRLLWPLNKPEAPFKNGKNSKKWQKELKWQKWPSTYILNSSYNFKAREKFIK